MRDRSVRNRLDLLDFQHAQIGEPTVKAKERIAIGTEVFRLGSPGGGAIELRHTDTPSMHAGAMPNPMMRRVKTSMTRITQRWRKGGTASLRPIRVLPNLARAARPPSAPRRDHP